MSRTVTEALRAAALGCAALVVVLCLVHDRADGPRWDALAALAAGAACAGAWALATRREAVPPPAPREFEGLPSVLPRDPVDWYGVAGLLLVTVAPFAAFRFGARGEVADRYLGLGAFPLVLLALALLPALWKALTRPLPEFHRLLARDARAGRVVAVRFTLETGEWIRIIDEDNRKVLDPDPEHVRALRLRDEHGAYYGPQGLLPGLYGRSPVGRLSRFAARFKGEHVWVLWPERWEPVLAVARRQHPYAYPVAVVSETGEMVWGNAAIEYTDRYLTDRSNLRPTVPGLAARPLRPRPRFHAPVHGRLYAGLAVAAAALVPLLLGLVSGAASAWLGLLAAVAPVWGLLSASGAAHRIPDPTRWTVPPVQDLRVPAAGGS
ncbi:hypothetical protein AB0E83_09645 [Streptomyces sp. NPDC035033]|uniref:hypothetical protein n=1 Tax=Streptomyces sp. NPDC035033 TaxID=3155368 RepID=UPI00340427B1